MLKKTHRITSKRLISLLFKKGKVYKNRPFLLRFLPSLHNNNQFVIIVSKKVSSKAVERNRIKRQTSEALQLHLNRFSPPIVALMVVKPSSVPYTYSELEKGILDFLYYYQHPNHV